MLNILMLFSLFACKPKPVQTQSNIAPQLAEKIGKVAFRKIYRADSISLYKLGAPDSAEVQIAGQGVVKGPMVLESDSFSAVRAVLLDDDNYVFDANVRCRLRANHALLIWLNGKEVQVLFSTRGNCPKVRFQSSMGKTVVSLSEKGYEALRQRVQGIQESGD